ncbi:MAG: 16S rRNA processing protein RimM [Candidatus Firestonebacteria bacterium]|nr:16S rRNA processing protein RimM [Candidatus Firestonebacteria bacterium]
MDYITIAEILSTFGIKGEVKLFITTDFPEKRFSIGSNILILDIHKKLIERKIEKVFWHKKSLIIKIKDCDSVCEAGKLVKSKIVINKDNRFKLPIDSYYISDIIGLDVYNNKGEYLGKIIDYFETDSNDVYVADGEGTEILIPAVKQVIKKIDLINKKMFVELLEEYAEN